MVKAVIFDLDGTLLNTYEDLANAVNYALHENGFPEHDAEKYKIFAGNGTDMMITRALPEGERNDETLQKVRKLYFEYYNAHSGECTRPYDGIVEMLSELKACGLKLAVVSNKIDFMTRAVVKEYFGDGMFDFVTGQCDGIIPKPDPSMVLKVMKEFDVLPSECIFVGDSGVDAETGVNAKVLLTVGVLWGFRGKEELIGCGADVVISKASQLLEYIK
ncbi:MAG: HAD family hydrolase [Clostridia bacterium]|nr:HAD family hydrolase [Clostridia bacterium]